MAEQPKEIPFHVDGLEVVEGDDGTRRLVLSGDKLVLSVFDTKHEDSIRVVLPDGREKIFTGIHDYLEQTKKLVVDTWIGDLDL